MFKWTAFQRNVDWRFTVPVFVMICSFWQVLSEIYIKCILGVLITVDLYSGLIVPTSTEISFGKCMDEA